MVMTSNLILVEAGAETAPLQNILSIFSMGEMVTFPGKSFLA